MFCHISSAFNFFPDPTRYLLYLLETNLCKDNFSKLCSTQFFINHINHFLTLANVTDLSSLFAVDPPSDLNFKIIDENTVHMSWERPADPIVGYRITVDSTTGEFQGAEVFGQKHQDHTVCQASHLTAGRARMGKLEGFG